MEIILKKNQPDSSINIAGMRRYGYGWEGMLPIQNKQLVKDIVHTYDITIYRLYPDGTEAELDYDGTGIESHDGLFGVDKADWNELVDRPEDKLINYAEFEDVEL